MSSIKNETIGGFNNFIEKQKEVKGTASITLVLFDDQYETPIESKDIKSVESLTEKTFVPRGMTALLDAVGKSINLAGERFDKMKAKDKPEKVMVCILTDGGENSSSEFEGSKIKEMIEHQKSKYDWEFAFLGANQDSFATAGNLGISANMTANFAATAVGTRKGYATMNCMTTSYRTGSKSS